jgi:hypothetical protein
VEERREGDETERKRKREGGRERERGGGTGRERGTLDHRTSSSGAVSADKDRHGDGQDGRPTGLSTSRVLSATTSLPSESVSSACCPLVPRSFLGILIYTPSAQTNAHCPISPPR